MDLLAPPPTPSPYEEEALRDIRAWKTPSRSWLDRGLGVLNRPVELAGDIALKIPGVERAIEQAFGGILKVLNDGAAWTVRTDAVLANFPDGVESLSDVEQLDLERIDEAIGSLATKYRALAGAQGAAAGAASLAGPAAGAAAVAADVPTLLALNLRAVGEYATYCGFDLAEPQQRLFALEVLGYASSPDDESRSAALKQLVRIAQNVAQRRAWKEIKTRAVAQATQRIAQALAARLTRAKLANLVPLAGVAISGGFNAYYTDRVCDAAFHLYREEFLARKYGADVIDPAGTRPGDEDVPETLEDEG